MVLCDGKGKADGGAFDHALVLVAHVAPELFMVGVCAACETTEPAVEAWVRTVACEEGGKAPDGTSEALEMSSSFVKVSASETEMDPGTAGGSMGGERVKKADEIVGELVLCVDGVGGEGGGICEGGHGGEGGEDEAAILSAWCLRGGRKEAGQVVGGQEPMARTARCWRPGPEATPDVYRCGGSRRG